MIELLGCVIITEKKCSNCEKDYLNEFKYCPYCGIKNPNFIELDNIINEFKRDVENNNYFDSEVKKEVKKIKEKIGNKSFSAFKTSSPNSDASKTSENASSGFGTSKSGSNNTFNTGKTANSNSPKKSTEVKCPKCGEKNDKSSNFCIKCGLDLKKVMVCPKCGSISSLGKFCVDCGTPLKKFK